MATKDKDKPGDLELLIPSTAEISELPKSKRSLPSSPACSTPHRSSGLEALSKVIRSYATKKFMTGCVILLPIAVTFYITWGFIRFVDGFFSPVYEHLGIDIFGAVLMSNYIILIEFLVLVLSMYPDRRLQMAIRTGINVIQNARLGFVTSITFIFLVGIFMSSWLGTSVLTIGELIIKKMPLVSYIYSASKQISAAISPDESSNAFKEVAIIRHPRIGEYALGFITSSVILQRSIGDEELCCVYVPTNHLYVGDVFLISAKDIMRPNLSVREGIEIIISGGVSVPQIMTITEPLQANHPLPRHRRSPSLG